MSEHRYHVTVRWTGNTGGGTATYRGYERAHDITAPGKPTISGSSEPAYRGDAARWNPEELLVASISACHHLWYLHLCSDARFVVTAYVDEAEGVMAAQADGSARFTSVILRPHVRFVAGVDAARALALHDDVGPKCAIALSVNFPITHEPSIEVAPPDEGEPPAG